MIEGKRKVKAYLQDSGYTEPVRFSQYDEILEGLSVEVYENVTANNPLSLTDLTVRLEGTKPDKKGYSYDGTVMGTYATFDVKQNMTAVPGEYDAEVVLIKTTNGKKERAGTAGIHFKIEAVGVQQDVDLSSSELAPYINAAKENAEIAEQALDGAMSTLKRVQTSEENAKAYTESALKAKNGTAQDLEKVKDSLDHTLESERRVVDAETRVKNTVAGIDNVEKSVEEAKTALSENTQKQKEIDAMYENIKATAAGKEFRGGTAEINATTGLVPARTAARYEEILTAAGWGKFDAEKIKVQDMRGFSINIQEKDDGTCYLQSYLTRLTELVETIKSAVKLPETEWQEKYDYNWHTTRVGADKRNLVEIMGCKDETDVEIYGHSVCLDYADVAIHSDAFHDNLTIETVTIHSGVTLEEAASLFFDCQNLRRVEFTGPVSVYPGPYGFSSMFMGAYELTDVIGMKYVSDKNIMNYKAMFIDTKISSIDLSNFEGRSFKSADSMFSRCKKLETVDLSNFDIVEKVKAMTGNDRLDAVDGMFDECESLKKVYLPKSFDSEFGRTLISEMKIPETANVTFVFN